MTTPPQKPSFNTSLTDKDRHWTLPFIGVGLFVSIQLLLRSTLDLRDYPGAAGTLSLLRATGNDTGRDIGAAALQFLQSTFNIDLHTANTLLSIGSGILIVAGCIAIAWRTFGRSVAMWTGILGALWTPHQLMALLTGVDPLILGSTMLALTTVTLGLFSGWFGVPATFLGMYFLLHVLQIKSISLPLCTVVGVWLIGPRRFGQWLFGLVGILTMYLMMQPQPDTRFPIPTINRRTLEFGWVRIHQLFDRGFPEGKFDQLWILGGLILLVWILVHRKYNRHHLRATAVWLLTGIGMFLTAASLGQVLRPRYLVGFGIGLIIPISWGISTLPKSFRHIVGWTLILLFTLDSWAFFGKWAEIRYQMLGGNPTSLPSAPYYWSQQYDNYPVLTLKDLTMTGALDFQDAWISQPNTQGIALPRLRDERHRNIQAYAAMRGQRILILDPGKCCAGKPVNAVCAEKVAQEVFDAGYSILLPTQLPDLERVYENEKSWIEHLRKNLSERSAKTDFWIWQPAADVSNGSVPCQFDVPFKRRQ